MKISQTLALLEGTAAGTQIPRLDSRPADQWIKDYLKRKRDSLEELKTSFSSMQAAYRMDKINEWEQNAKKVASGGDWAVTDAEGIIISTWKTKEEADKAAYSLYKGIVPSNSQGNKVKKLTAGGPGSGCKGPDCGRPGKGVGMPQKEKCYACGKKLGKNPNLAVTQDGQVQYVGSECYKQIGQKGFQPPKGGPRLYKGHFGPNRELVGVDGLKDWKDMGEVKEWNKVHSQKR